MTQKEKAKAYDEALERAKEFIVASAAYDKFTIEKIFPELKESEDDKIRRIVYGWINTQPSSFFDLNGISKEDMLTWLEKQGKQKTIWHSEDEEPKRDSLILLIMQSGNAIVAKIIEPNHTFNHGERWAYIDDLLEKQSEKPQGKSALEAINEEKVDNQNCVKSTDKVEPKFNVGDKIQHKNGYSLDVSILKINADCYTVKDFMGDQITIDFTHQDNYELVPGKFDLNTLKPFESSVLVRNSKDQYWIPAFWGYRAKDGYVTTFGHSFYCIPYEGNKHLFTTKDDCSDFYKNWE